MNMNTDRTVAVTVTIPASKVVAILAERGTNGAEVWAHEIPLATSDDMAVSNQLLDHIMQTHEAYQAYEKAYQRFASQLDLTPVVEAQNNRDRAYKNFENFILEQNMRLQTLLAMWAIQYDKRATSFVQELQS